jgi:hypothetical protein
VRHQAVCSVLAGCRVPAQTLCVLCTCSVCLRHTTEHRLLQMLTKLSAEAGRALQGWLALAWLVSRATRPSTCPPILADCCLCWLLCLCLQGRVWGGFGRKEEPVGRLDFTEGQAPGAAANGNGTAEDLGSSLIDAPEEDYDPIDDEPAGQVGRQHMMQQHVVWCQ